MDFFKYRQLNIIVKYKQPNKIIECRQSHCKRNYRIINMVSASITYLIYTVFCLTLR